ncbi:copper resistance CopC family protein [Mycolicibacterium mengxianglii]|uniref:copper resistance CopC family protein n=1 Tax=Mycolicibacterium mengxianglii TaxID=2736649 RepID=UPI0018D0E55E|nr:copper resistance CopC family protein [Mycolicibacterium mengxianglii]
MRTAIRWCLTTFLVIALSVAGSATVSAHAVLVSSDPIENASLPTNPEQVSATFNEQMQPAFAAMTVIGPDGSQWSDGQVLVQGSTLSVGVRPQGPAGTYTVNYRATSADGHVVSGSWSYLVTEAPATPAAPPSGAPATDEPVTTAPAAPAAPAEGIPVWPFILGASLIVVAGALWAVRRRL